MFEFLMLADAASHATQDVQDGLAGHNWLMVAAGGLVLIAPIVLKAFGVTVPVLDPILDAGLSLLEKATAKQAPIDPVKQAADLKAIADQAKAAEAAPAAKPVDPAGK